MSALTEKLINERETKDARMRRLYARRNDLLAEIRTIDQELEVLHETLAILTNRIHSHRIMDSSMESFPGNRMPELEVTR